MLLSTARSTALLMALMARSIASVPLGEAKEVPMSGSNTPRWTRTGTGCPSRAECLGIFFCSLVLFCAASTYLITQLGITGDEPWYLLLGYSLVHFHTVDMAQVVHDPGIYRHFVGSLEVGVGRAWDFRGNGVLVQVYLPGYAAIVGALYALGGRWLIVCVQSLGGALIATLLFQETYRLWQSRAAALFATVVYVTSLPALMYASQVFPTMLASVTAFVAFIAVVRVLPTAVGWRSIVAGGGIGVLAAVLPWLHVKYAPLALVIVAAALLQLASASRTERIRLGALPDKAAGVAAKVPLPAAGHIVNRPAVADGSKRGNAWATAALISGPLLASFALVVVYSQRYFGTWYPQYRSFGAFAKPDPIHMLGLYRQMFLDGPGALIPWIPLTLLVPAGLVVLTRHATREGGLTALWIGGVLSAFLSSAIAPHVNQAYALPARFTVECQPYFTLSVASLFAVTWPKLRASIPRVSPGRGVSALWLRRGGALVALCCLLLVGVDAWFTVVGLLDPLALYPSATGVGVPLILHYPHLLPGWWFALFGIHGP